jgi:hypothetical protein
MKTFKSFPRSWGAETKDNLNKHFYFVRSKVLLSVSYASIRNAFTIGGRLKSLMVLVICFINSLVSVYSQEPFEKYYTGTGRCMDVQPIHSDGYIGIVNYWDGGIFWLFRMNEQGDTLWTKKFQSGGEINNRWAIKIAVAKDGGYFILCGNSILSYSCLFNTVLKTNDHGDSLWQTIISSTDMWANAGFKDLIATPDDNGCVAVGDGSFGGNRRILKLNSSGAILWETAIAASIYKYFSSVCQSSDNGYIATGLNHNNITGLTSLLVAKFNSDGDTL